MSGSSVGPPASVSLRTAAASHPSAPIPVQGPALGEGVRVALGESGLDVFPLALGGAEFGWNVDVEASHGILDTYARSEEHTSELQSLMRISYAVFCLKKKQSRST